MSKAGVILLFFLLGVLPSAYNFLMHHLNCGCGMNPLSLIWCLLPILIMLPVLWLDEDVRQSLKSFLKGGEVYDYRRVYPCAWLSFLVYYLHRLERLNTKVCAIGLIRAILIQIYKTFIFKENYYEYYCL